MKQSIFKFNSQPIARFVSEHLSKLGYYATSPASMFLKIEGYMDDIAAAIIKEHRGTAVSVDEVESASTTASGALTNDPSTLDTLTEDHVASSDRRRWSGSSAGKGKYILMPNELKRKKKMQLANDSHCVVLDPTTNNHILVQYMVKDELPEPKETVKEEEKPEAKKSESSPSLTTAAVALLKKVIEKDPKKYPKLAAELGIKSKK